MKMEAQAERFTRQPQKARPRGGAPKQPPMKPLLLLPSLLLLSSLLRGPMEIRRPLCPPPLLLLFRPSPSPSMGPPAGEERAELLRRLLDCEGELCIINLSRGMPTLPAPPPPTARGEQPNPVRVRETKGR